MFYSMLYSSNADEFAAAPRDERLWMVRFLTEGLARTQVRQSSRFVLARRLIVLTVCRLLRTGKSIAAVKFSSSSRRSFRRRARIPRSAKRYSWCVGAADAAAHIANRHCLQFLVRATRIHAAARELVSRNGLLGWLSVQAWQDAEERQFALDTVLNVLAILPWDKLPGVADAVEAVEGAVRGFVNAPLHGDGEPPRPDCGRTEQSR